MNQDSNKNPIRKIQPYIVEFVKFLTGFAVILAAALLILRIASASML